MEKMISLPPRVQRAGKKEETIDRSKYVEITATVSPRENQQIRSIRQIPVPQQPQRKEKLADVPHRKLTPVNKFIQNIPLIGRLVNKRDNRRAEPQGPVLLQLLENKRCPISGLRLQIGDDEDSATLVIVELFHRKVNEESYVDLHLNAQAPRSGEHVAGRIEQATIHIKFCYPDSSPSVDKPIMIDEFVSLDAEPSSKVATITESNESTWNAQLKLARDPEATLGHSRKGGFQATVERAPMVEISSFCDDDWRIRWVIEVNDSLPNARINRHGFRHRIGRHPQVKAHIRLSCQCRKEKYVKPIEAPLEVVLDMNED